MTASSYRYPFSQVDSKAPKGQTDAADLTDLLSDRLVEITQERWQAKLLSLQEWICVLLIKNQQLRMTLIEMKAREQEDASGRNADSSRSNPTVSVRLS